jgi:hypothetical protein
MARKPACSIDVATKPELFASSTNSLRAVSRPACVPLLRHATTSGGVRSGSNPQNLTARVHLFDHLVGGSE